MSGVLEFVKKNAPMLIGLFVAGLIVVAVVLPVVFLTTSSSNQQRSASPHYLFAPKFNMRKLVGNDQYQYPYPYYFTLQCSGNTKETACPIRVNTNMFIFNNRTFNNMFIKYNLQDVNTQSQPSEIILINVSYNSTEVQGELQFDINYNDNVTSNTSAQLVISTYDNNTLLQKIRVNFDYNTALQINYNQTNTSHRIQFLNNITTDNDATITLAKIPYIFN